MTIEFAPWLTLLLKLCLSSICFSFAVCCQNVCHDAFNLDGFAVRFCCLSILKSAKERGRKYDMQEREIARLRLCVCLCVRVSCKCHSILFGDFSPSFSHQPSSTPAVRLKFIKALLLYFLYFSFFLPVALVAHWFYFGAWVATAAKNWSNNQYKNRKGCDKKQIFLIAALQVIYSYSIVLLGWPELFLFRNVFNY